VEARVSKESASDKVGKRYRIRVLEGDRDRFFDQSWTAIDVEMDGQVYRFELEKAFWTTCPEFRDGKTGPQLIRDWLERHNVPLTWPPSSPPKVRLEPVPASKGRFRILP
jgi:hypothetical protein